MGMRSTPPAQPLEGTSALDAFRGDDAGETSWVSGERPVEVRPEWGPGQVLADRYRIEKAIGEGGMSRVFAAFDTKDSRRVALKVVDFERGERSQLEARLKREIEVAEQLTGEAFVPMFDHGIRADCAYIAMELLDGESLQARLSRRGKLGAHATLELVRGIAVGLRAAHELCIVHRDLKPSNVFFSRSGRPGQERVRLLDFGIAKDQWTSSKLTHAGALLGSPHYVSPEQARAQEVDHRSDLWSLAVMAYRCLTGARPFDGNLTQLIVRIVKQPHAPASKLAPELGPKLDTFFERALAKKADERFQDVDTLVAALTDVLTDAPLDADPFENDPISKRMTPQRSHPPVKLVSASTPPSRQASKSQRPSEPVSERTQMAAASYDTYVAAITPDRASFHPTVEVQSPLAGVDLEGPQSTRNVPGPAVGEVPRIHSPEREETGSGIRFAARVDRLSLEDVPTVAVPTGAAPAPDPIAAPAPTGLRLGVRPRPPTPIPRTPLTQPVVAITDEVEVGKKPAWIGFAILGGVALGALILVLVFFVL